MAYLEKQKNGKWRAQIRQAGVSSISKTFITKAEAQRWATEVEKNPVGNFNADLAAQTVDFIFNKYLHEVSPKKAGGKAEIIRILKWMREVDFMKLPMRKLSHHHLKEWRDNRLTEVSSSSVKRECNLMFAVINYAIREWDAPIPTGVTKVSRPQEHKPRSRNVSKEEIKMIWSVCPGPIGSTAKSYVPVIFEFCCETAMRMGEALAIKWQDLDASGDNHWAVLHTSKNGYGRSVPFTKRAVELIGMLPKGAGTDPVFDINAGTLGAQFRDARRSVGLNDLHFHDSRHQATLMLSQHLPVLELAKVTGHKSLGVLLNTYYQPTGAYLAEKLSTAYDPSQSTR